MDNKLYQKFKTLEIYGLFVLFFCIPFLKVGKSIGFCLLLIGAIGKISIRKSFSFKQINLLEYFLIGMLVTGFISTIINWPIYKGFSGFKDTLQFFIIFSLISRSKFSYRKLDLLFWCIVAGSVIGLIIGYLHWNSGSEPYITFQKLSIANTAIIIGMISSSIFGKLIEWKRPLFSIDRLLLCLSLLFLSFCLFMGGNRSGIIGLAAFLITLPFFIRLNVKTIVIFIMIMIIPSIGIWHFKSDTSRMSHLLSFDFNLFDYNSMSGNDQFRFDYWRVSFAQFTQGQKKIVGIGPRNFRGIDINQLEFDPPLKNFRRLKKPIHAHNWLLTKVVEEGILGLFFILAFWIRVLFILLKTRAHENNYHWSYSACLGAIIIPAIGGLFYSPFLREVSWISMMYIGLALSVIKNNPPIE